MPSHLLDFLTTKPDLGSELVEAPPDMTLVKKEPRLSLLKAAVIVATTDLLGETAITAGYPNPKFNDLSKSS